MIVNQSSRHSDQSTTAVSSASGHSRRFDRVQVTSGLTPQADIIADCRDVSKVPTADSYLLKSPNAGVSAAVRSTSHRSVVADFQKRKRNPTVGAMLLRWRKPKANPPFTCVNMIPE